MSELDTVLLCSLLADEKAIAVGVMYPGEDTPTGIPLIRVADIVEGRISSTVGYRISEEVNSQYRRTQLSGNEVLMTLVGRPGTAIKVPPEMTGWNVARALAVLRLADPAERDFFVYSVASPQVQHTIRNWCNTTVQATLNLKEIKALPLPWPDRSTRRAIAATLGALDDKIELNRRMNETLEAMARALFRDWFVDFGPTRAKMAGTAPYLSPDLWSLFPDRLDDHGKPEGWQLSAIGEVAKNHSETMDLKKRQKVIFINTGDVSQGRFLHADYSDAKGLPGQAKKKIEAGDILYSEIRPKNRRYAFVNFDAPDHIVSTKFMVLRTISTVSPVHLYFLVSSPEAVEEFNVIAESRSGTFPQITFDSIKHYPVMLASEGIMKAFSEILELIFGFQGANEQENETLAQTRDLLLPRLMSGELRVADLDQAEKETAA